MRKRVNIFNFATGELTNDAMICWIVSQIKDDRKEYKELAKDVINLFTKKRIENIETVHVEQQYKKIDVLIKVNDDELIIVEDKVNSGEHDNQLKRYMDLIEKDTDKDIINRNKNYVYLKIGNESNYQNNIICYDCKENLKEEQYLYVSRKMLLDVLKRYKNINNDILRDYIEHLEEKEELFNRYRNYNILEKWGWGCEGYFSELQKYKEIKSKCWQYISNKSGGFLGFWWNSKSKEYKVLDIESIPYEIYLQIEARPQESEEKVFRVVFKVSCKNKSCRSEIRNYVWSNLKELLLGENDFNKTRFNSGTWMTIAEKRCTTKDELNDAICRAEYLIAELDKTT